MHKQIIRNFEKRKSYSPFTDNIWGADLADMQLINDKLLYVINIVKKYARAVPLKDKKVLQLLILFEKYLTSLTVTQENIDKDNEFYDRPTKS